MNIDHIGVAVRSIDRTLEFYRDVLGIEPSHRTQVFHENVEVAVLPTAGGRIELLRSTSQDSVIDRFIQRHGEGLHHIAVQVDDLDAAVERVKRSSGRLVDEKPQIGAEGYRYVFVHPKSTGGVLLELVQRVPKGS